MGRKSSWIRKCGVQDEEGKPKINDPASAASGNRRDGSVLDGAVPTATRYVNPERWWEYAPGKWVGLTISVRLFRASEFFWKKSLMIEE